MVKEHTCQCRRCRRCKFDPWVGKAPWRRKWQPAPVFLAGESHGQRSLEGYSPWGRKDSDTTEATSTHTEMSLKLKKERHRSYKALLAVWGGAQPGVSPAPGATQRPAPGPDRDEAGRAGPSLRAELSRPAACAGLEEAGRRLRPQTQAAVQGVLPCGGPDLKQPAQENNSIALRLNFPPKSQQPLGIFKSPH